MFGANTTDAMSDDHDADYWRFCEIVERREVTGPTVTTPPRTERVVLEQHTGTGDYRTRPLDAALGDAGD